MNCENCGAKVEPLRIDKEGLGVWQIVCCGYTVENPLLERVVWLWLNTDRSEHDTNDT